MSTRTNNRLRRPLRGSLLVTVVLVLLAGAGSASVAQERPTGKPESDSNALQVSLDGTTWTDSIVSPLFDPEVRWVPGDVRTSIFYVRNNKAEAGDLSLVLERPLRDALLETSFLTIAARAGDGPWTEVSTGGRQELIDSEKTAAGDEVAVELRASFAADALNTTMVLPTDLDLRLTLTQAGIVADATSTDGDGNPTAVGGSNASSGPDAGSLPDTGSPLRPWVLPLALLLLGAGAVLVARRTDLEEDF